MKDNIFVPNYRITSSMKRRIKEIEDNSWLIENMLLMPKHEAWIRRQVSVRRAVGTTRIEGATLDEEAVDDLIRKGRVGKLSDDQQANLNAINAYEFIDYLSDQDDIPIDELVIRQINRELLRGASEILTPGIYRKGENKVGDYIPPNQGDVPALMRSFALWLRSNDKSHPIVKAGIAHIHLVAIHPFWDGNGRTARGLATLILQRSQLSFKKLLSLEALFSSERDRYFSAIERTLGAHHRSKYDATPWLQLFIRGLLKNSVYLKAMLTDWHRVMTRVREKFERRNLNSRQADGCAYAYHVGKITRPEYIEVTGASPVTSSRDLAMLVELEILVPKGNTRARVYYPVEELDKSERQPSTE